MNWHRTRTDMGQEYDDGEAQQDSGSPRDMSTGIWNLELLSILEYSWTKRDLFLTNEGVLWPRHECFRLSASEHGCHSCSFFKFDYETLRFCHFRRRSPTNWQLDCICRSPRVYMLLYTILLDSSVFR